MSGNCGDISGVVHISTRTDGMTWCRKLPERFKGVSISTKYILLDTKRSATNYKNEIDGDVVRYCLSNRPNFMNVYLLRQLNVPVSQKEPIRVGEYACTGSTKILDRGDYVVMAPWNTRDIILHRLSLQSELPTGQHFSHPSEERALDLLLAWFPADKYKVKYEPITIHFDSQIVGGEAIHSYTPDFVISTGQGPKVAIEAKENASALTFKLQQTKFKAHMWGEEMDASCFVLTVWPEPRLISFGADGCVSEQTCPEDFVQTLSLACLVL